MKNIVIIVGIAGLSIAVLLFSLLYTGIIRFNYPDKKQFPIRGIDISHHQKKIDWEKVRKEEVFFIFIKATEGGDWKDPLFHDNWAQAEQAGLVRGAYHFFTLCTSGKAQARNFIETVPNEADMLPPVIDFELGGNCKARPPQPAILKELEEFIHEIENIYRVTPILYTTYSAYEYYLKGEFAHIKIWIRDIFSHPKLPHDARWDFWQYSNRGRLDGIATYVDLNVFNGNKAQFDQLLKERIGSSTMNF